MSTAPSNDPNARSIPPDPGGRSRYLIRGIAIACVVLAVIAVALMVTLHQNAPPAKPTHQQNSGSGGMSWLVHPRPAVLA